MPWLTTDQDSFYKTLTPAQSKLAFANEYDFDSPDVRRLDPMPFLHLRQRSDA